MAKKFNLLSLCLLTISFLFFTKTYARAYSPQAYEPRGASAMSSLDRLPYLKTGTSMNQVSSYDRSGGNNDGSMNTYYQNPQTGGMVVMEEYHPGTIYRIWATNLNGGNVRIYFDKESTPRIDMPVSEFFSGSSSPFLEPLVGNDQVSSGGFYSYYPISFRQAVRVEFTTVPGYYDISYHLYNTSDNVTTYTGTEDLSAIYATWQNPTQDPKDTTGNESLNIPSINLPAGQTQTLLDIASGGSIRAVKLTFPQFKTTQPSGPNPQITDSGKAFLGNSTFNAAINPANAGVILTRRFDYGIADQTANVYVDGSLVGQWSTPGGDGTDKWRDSDFNIPASFTSGKSSIGVKIELVSSGYDWNEFYYWIKSITPAGTVQTDSLDVNDSISETAHNYLIASQTWEGTRTYTYPRANIYDNATLDILSNSRIKMYWDGEAVPSVDLPLGFLFGVGSSGEGSNKALLMGVDSTTHTYYNYFPMPYKTSAKILLVNNSATTISQAVSTISYNSTLYNGLGTNAGYFVGQYNKQDTISGIDFHWGNFSGKGQIVGTILNITGTDPGVLEGDERIFIDQNAYNPQVHGTGTEDFFNAGFYFNKGIFSLPVHGNTLNYWNNGVLHLAAYRLELADNIPFEKSINLNLEHGPINNMNATYEGAVFAYVIKNTNNLILSDNLTVGDSTSENAHAYSITGQTWLGSLWGDFFGRDIQAIFQGPGRAHMGTSNFTLKIPSTNSGVRLARILNPGIGNQKADIYVDNVLAGNWYTGGINTSHQALYDYFEIPPSLTANKSSIKIKIQFDSSNVDWNEFIYFAYAHGLSNSSPVISITTPKNNSSVNKNTSVTIKATATDNVAISKIDFYVDSSLTCTSVTSPYSCFWNVPNTKATHILMAKIYDISGNVLQSSNVKVTAK